MSANDTIRGLDEARKAVLANMSPRTRELDMLERYVEGSQYDGRKSWFDGDVPMQERAPCIVYPLVASAIESNVDLLLGEGRFPIITTNPGEDDDELDEGDEDGGLDEDQSAIVDRGIKEMSRQVRFRALCREAFGAAQGCGSAVALFGVRAGKLFAETVRAKWCERKLDHEGRVTELVIQYPYIETFRDKDGAWACRAKLYRRVISAERDVTMLPVDAPTEGQQIKWAEDPALSVAHGLGFCPALWYSHMRGCATVEQVDGKALHARVLDEVEALDMSLSQRHSTALYCGSPQLVEIGVEPGYNPSEAGRTPVIPATREGGVMSTKNPARGGFTAGPNKARKKGVQIAWQYEGKSGETLVEYLTIPEGAVKVLDEHGHDLRTKIAESLSVVFLDPENIKFAATTSGKALETLRQRQVNRCDQYRDDFGDLFVVPAVEMLLRIVHRKAQTEKLRMRGAAKVAKTLADFVANDNGAPEDWLAPFITLKWGAYSAPDPAEETAVVQATVAAKNAGIITKRIAVEKVKRIFQIENVDETLETLEEEADEHASLEASLASMAAGGEPVAKKKAKGASKAKAKTTPKTKAPAEEAA